MNYEALLRKYIEHIRACEGVDYVDRVGSGPLDSGVEFSDDEIAALRRLSEPCK